MMYAPRRLTPTERRLIVYVGDHEGVVCTKAELAQRLGCNPGTIDRLISRLRAEGMLVTEPTYSKSGVQRANSYRLSKGWITVSA